jgi:hypothetical protein
MLDSSVQYFFLPGFGSVRFEIRLVRPITTNNQSKFVKCMLRYGEELNLL